MDNNNNLPEIRSIKALQEEFDKVFLMRDRAVVPLLCSVILANQMDNDPVWLLIISPPSGGKSELIEALELITLKGKSLTFPISDLTVNTFASGQKKLGKETSLLHKMPYGSIMTFKDFTSMISKNKDAQQEIMGQLREIYDRRYVKRTGTGDDIIWRGKVGAIAGCTEAIYESNEQFSVMGDRFLMYSMVQPDRMEVLNRVIDTMSDKDSKFNDKKMHLRRCIKSFIENLFEHIETTALDLPPDTRKDLLEVVNFITMVASGVIVDKHKGNIEFVPSKTMPMRMAKQILAIAQSFVLMNKNEPSILEFTPAYNGNLTAEQTQILYKLAFDTIPIKRRMALRALTKYKLGVTTGGLATSIGYQTIVVGQWLAQLNALGICSREKVGMGDKWCLNEQYREIIAKFEKIEIVDKEMNANGDDENYNTSWNQEAQVYRESEMVSLDPIGDDEYQEQIFNNFGKTNGTA